MTPVDKIRDLINTQELKLRDIIILTKQLYEAYGKTYLQCNECDSRSKVNTLLVYQIKRYEETPYNGFWYHSHYVWECPECKTSNKIDMLEASIPFESFRGRVSDN